MAGDMIRDIRRAVLAALKADAGVTAIVPAPRIHPQTVPANPAWPFIRWDGPVSTPIDAACTRGAEVSFTLHAFAKPRTGAGGRVIETAEDHASRAITAVHTAMHGRRIAVGARTARIRCRSAQIMIDGDEPDAFHAFTIVYARLLTERA